MTNKLSAWEGLCFTVCFSSFVLDAGSKFHINARLLNVSEFMVMKMKH